MDNLLNKEYIHIGTDHINRESWLNMNKDLFYKINIKPGGNLWCTESDNNLGEWIKYLKQTAKEYFYDIVGNKKCCLIKFKENSRVLKIDAKEDFYNDLKNKGYIIELKEPFIITVKHKITKINYILNYKKIIKDYDLLYIDPIIYKDDLGTGIIDENLSIYRISTMLILNIDCIEYYKPLDVDYYDQTILKEYPKEYIKDINEDYYKLVRYIKRLINSKAELNKENIRKIQEFVCNYIEYNKDKFNFKFDNTIDEHNMINNIVNNLVIKRDGKRDGKQI